MESINNLPPQLTPKESGNVAGKAVAAFNQETTKLVNIGKESAPPPPTNLGAKIDLKA